MDFDAMLEITLTKHEIEQELQKGPIPIPREGHKKFTVAEVFALLVNPTYTGVGPYPKIIDDELWIKAVAKQIQQLGPELVLRVLLDSLRQSMS